MIALTDKTRQDFLDRSFSALLRSAGVDMSDSKYVIFRVYISSQEDYKDFVALRDSSPTLGGECIVPTYTLSELLYKLYEYPSIDIEKKGKIKSISAPLSFIKDAPFYIFKYSFFLKRFYRKGSKNESKQLKEICGKAEYPIEAAAYLLLECAKNGIGFVNNISSK